MGWPLRATDRLWINEDMTGPEFLTELHSQFEASRDAVVGMVERAAGYRVDQLQRLTVGDENEVYRVRLIDDSVVYARIRRPGDGSFEPEAWAMEQARSAGTAIPHVLTVEEIETEDGPRSAMLIAESSGRQLAAVLPVLTQDQRRRAMVNLGRELARLHTVATPGVGRPDAGGRWPDPREAKRTFIAERSGQRAELISAGLTPDEVQAIIAQIGASSDTPAPTRPVLCHGDLHAAHVFVDDDLEVCGVIDWGLWHGGSAVSDLAAASMLHDPQHFEAILTGHFTIGSAAPSDLRLRLSVAIINQAIGHIAWHVNIGNAEGTAHYVARLRAALVDAVGST